MARRRMRPNGTATPDRTKAVSVRAWVSSRSVGCVHLIDGSFDASRFVGAYVARVDFGPYVTLFWLWPPETSISVEGRLTHEGPGQSSRADLMIKSGTGASS